MAGMLPGVELARRRRTNHHQYEFPSREPSQRLLEPSTTMDEAALKARRRLEQKLRGSAGSRWTIKPQPTAEGRSFNPVGNATTQTTSTRESWRIQLDRRNSQREVCSICLEDFRIQENITCLPCAHRYHADCLLPWLSSHPHCPYCRTQVQQSS